MKAYVLINASPGRALEVAKKMEGVSGISAADAITGEYDVIAVCEAPDVNSIGSLIVDKIQKIDGVFKTITCLAVKYLQQPRRARPGQRRPRAAATATAPWRASPARSSRPTETTSARAWSASRRSSAICRARRRRRCRAR